MAIFNSDATVTEVRKSDDASFEYLCIDIQYANSDQATRFLCIYFPPDLSQNTEAVKSLCSCISKHQSQHAKLFIIGDFNLPFIDWKNQTSTTRGGKEFLNFCEEVGLQQLVLEPTTTSGSTLDLIFCDNFSSRTVQSIKVLPPLSSTCDHNIIEISLSFPKSSFFSTITSHSFHYEKGDYDLINNKLSKINWEKAFQTLDYNVELIYCYFLDVIHLLTELHIPKRKPTNKIKRPRHLSLLAKQKLRLFKKSKTDIKAKSDYKKLSKEYDNAVSAWYDHIENKICNSKYSSNFYRYANKKLNSYPSIPPLVTNSGNVIMDSNEKANFFNETFQSVFTKDDGKALNIPPRLDTFSEFNLESVDEETVSNLLKTLPSKSSKTPDDLPPILLKMLTPSITTFLCKFYTLSLKSGIVPTKWKMAIITPIYKKGAKSNPQNYRPISLTSVVCRLLELYISTALRDHLLSTNLLSQNQHGFLPRRSSSTQLLKAVNDWIQLFNKNETVAVVYTDLRKAFDTVSHVKLMQVLESYCINSKMLKWFNSFLTDRSQVVRVNDCLSEPLDVLSGVPQGSVIGPLLFLIYIDDISKHCSKNTTVSLFADDAKLYSSDKSDLQKSLGSTTNFFEIRQLRLAPEKCEKLLISKKSEDFDLHLENTSLPNVPTVKDLGVIISGDMKWCHQADSMRKKGFARSFIVLKSFHSKNI